MPEHSPLPVFTPPLNGQQLMTALIKSEKTPSKAWKKSLISPEISQPINTELAH